MLGELEARPSWTLGRVGLFSQQPTNNFDTMSQDLNESASDLQPPRLRILSGTVCAYFLLRKSVVFFCSLITQMMFVVQGKGKTVVLKDGANEVGRSLTCQVSLDGDGISKVHAVITVDGMGVFVEDKASTNKSMLGSLEEPVELVPGSKYPMEHGDVVVFGDVACVFLWRAMQGYGTSRSINTAPVFTGKPGESGMQSPMRPHTTTTGFANPDITQEEVLGQLDVLMQGMSQLYSIVQGAPQSPSHSSFAANRQSTHASGLVSSFGGTRMHTASDSIGMHDQSSVSFALDRSDLPQYSPYRQGQAQLSFTATEATGFSGFDRAGANLQGAGLTSSQGHPSLAADAPVPVRGFQTQRLPYSLKPSLALTHTIVLTKKETLSQHPISRVCTALRHRRPRART